MDLPRELEVLDEAVLRLENLGIRTADTGTPYESEAWGANGLVWHMWIASVRIIEEPPAPIERKSRFHEAFYGIFQRALW